MAVTLFDEIGDLRKQIRHLDNQIDYCKEQAMKIPGPVWGEEKLHTQPSGKAPFEKWVLKQLDLEKEKSEIEAKLEEKRLSLTEYLSSIIKDENTLKVILYREVSFLTFEKISEKMKISRSYIYRLHKAGLEELEKLEQK